MVMEEERKSVVRQRKEIEAAEDPTQRRLGRMRRTITGIGTISSKNDPDEWETHTPKPSANDEEEDDSEDEKSD